VVAPALGDVLGPRGRRRSQVASVVALAAIGLVIYLALKRFADAGELAWEKWEPLTQREVIRFFGEGLLHTLQAAAISLVLASLFGMVLALGRLSPLLPLRTVSRTYTEFFRGFPLILLIVFAFFGLPELGIELTRFASVCLALVLYNSAVLGEIFRAGILSLDRGQTEAADAIGLRRGQAMRMVILPQSIRRMTPTIVSQFVTLLKDTSLGFAIGYEELLRTGQIAGVFYKNELQALIAVTLIFLAVNFTLSRIARRLELRQRRRYKADPIAATAGPEDLVGVGLASSVGPGKV
jgi:glutamate transport system permease protein